MDGSRFKTSLSLIACNPFLVQAGVVYACIWSLGGCLADEGERIKFDQSIREVFVNGPKQNIYHVIYFMKVIFGKRSDCPLPKSLNGKFDALPPIEVQENSFL